MTGDAGIVTKIPDELAARHQLSADLAGNLAAINPLTDALVAP